MPTEADALTRLPNRLALSNALKQSIDKHAPVAVALLDIDGFLEINTEQGQNAGDVVLRELAALLSELVPGQAYHFSGDEFAVALTGSTLEQAFLKVEGLRAQIHASDRFGLPAGQRLAVTIGVAQYPRDAKDAPGLLQAADAALSNAKESGRNQVGLPPNEEMVMKSCYYPASSIRRLKALGERLGRKDSPLLREALDDLFRKYDVR